MSDYATVQQLRDEGVTNAQASDVLLLAKIKRAGALIERWTGRWFYPRSQTLMLDGSGGNTLQIGPPIISIAGVRVLDYNSNYSGELLSSGDFRVYNRHLTQLLTDPDDRNNPKIQWISACHDRSSDHVGVFPRGVQNIELTGMFGYTDPDPALPTVGKTPDLINFACMLLVIRDLPRLSDVETRDEQKMRHRVTSLQTRDQSISWGSSRVLSGWTGDAEIDSIIASYRRPPTLGAV